MKKRKERSDKSRIIRRSLLLAFLLFWIVTLLLGMLGAIAEQIEYGDLSDGSGQLFRDYERGEYDAMVTDLSYYVKDDASRETNALYIECAEGYMCYIRCLECRSAARNTGDEAFTAEAQAQYAALSALAQQAQHDTNRDVFARFLAALDAQQTAGEDASDTSAAP